MKPIYTIDAGEYLVATQIEKKFKNFIVWLPSKDTGIDLLLTDKANKKTTSIQVKFSKDFNVTHTKKDLRQNIEGVGWWTLNKNKIEKSKAEFWIFVIYNIKLKDHHYIIMTPKQLLDIFKKLNRLSGIVHCYFTVTSNFEVYETRGLNNDELRNISNVKKLYDIRNVTRYLNNWDPIINKLK